MCPTAATAAGAITVPRRRRPDEPEAQRPGDDIVGDLAGVYVESASQPGIALERRLPAEVGQRTDIRQCRVGERERGSTGNGTRHVGNAVVNDAIHDKRRIRVRRRLAGLEAATLVDGDVDEHGARLHRSQHGPSHELRCGRAGDQHSAHDEVGIANQPLDCLGG